MVKLSKISWFTQNQGAIYSIDVHPDNTRIAISQDSTVFILGLTELLAQVDLECKYVVSHRKDSYDFDRTYLSYENCLIATIAYHQNNVNTLKFSKCGTYLALGSDDQNISVFELRYTEKTEKEMEDEVHVLEGGDEDDGINWDTRGMFEEDANDDKVEKWELNKLLGEHNGIILSLVFTTTHLVSSSINNLIHFYNVAEKFRLHKVINTQSIIKGLSVCPVEKFVFGEGDKEMILIDITRSFKIRSTIKKEKSTQVQCCRNSFSPCGEFIIGTNYIKGSKNVIPFMTRHPYEIKHFFFGHKSEIAMSMFNPSLFHTRKNDQKESSKNSHEHVCFWISVSNDNQIVLWNNVQKKPILILKSLFYDRITDLCWTKDSYSCILTSTDGSFILLRFDKNELGVNVKNLKEILTKRYGRDLSILEYPPYNMEKVQKRKLRKISRKRKRTFQVRRKRFKTEKFQNIPFQMNDNTLIIYINEKVSVPKSSIIDIDDNENDDELSVTKTVVDDMDVDMDANNKHGKSVKIFFKQRPDIITKNSKFIIVFTLEKFLHFFTINGIRISPPILINKKIIKFNINENHDFACLTSGLLLYVFNIEEKKKKLECSLIELKESVTSGVNKKMKNENFVDNLIVHNNGYPLVTLYNADNYLFDFHWNSFVKLNNNYLNEENLSFEKDTNLKLINDLEVNLQISRNLSNGNDYILFLQNYVSILSGDKKYEGKLKEFVYDLMKEKEKKICGFFLNQLLEIILKQIKNERLVQEFSILLKK